MNICKITNKEHTRLDSWWENDARGIPLRRVCDRCVHLLQQEYRSEVLTDPNYAADEAIEPEDY